MNTITVRDKTFELLLSPEALQERAQALGDAIRQRYAGKTPVFIPVLNGAFIFAADLIRYAELDCEVSFVKLASYQGLESTGEVSTRIGLDVDIRGKDVILVEDIIDTGNTLHAFLPVLERMGPRSITIAAMLMKPDMLKHALPVAFVGFEIPSAFVVGYGLDYDGFGRNLPGIFQLKR